MDYLQRQKMNHIYKYQKYIYDLTRKYYLNGRDTLIKELRAGNNLKQIVEIGCGNGRNLFKLNQYLPNTFLLGIDICDEMLTQGLQKITKRQSRIKLVNIDASFLREQLPSHLAYPPDHILALYSFSMMPNWKAIIEQCLSMLPKGATLKIVDFTDFDHLPTLFCSALNHWMNLFSVEYRAPLQKYVQNHPQTKSFSIKLNGLYFYAELGS